MKTQLKPITQASINKRIKGRGFTLIEVMVAMVIFAIGMMGLASLQSLSIRNNSQSNSRGQAVLFAYDMADRMRANIAGGNNYQISFVNNTDGSLVAVNCVANPCTAAQLTNSDRSAWVNQIQNALTGGIGIVTALVAANTYRITVHWDEDRSGAAGLACPPLVATDLRCFQLDVVAN